MSSDLRPGDQWERVAAELKAQREAQRKAWGDIDNLLLGRYLAADTTAEEREQVEAALEQHPDLRFLTEVVSEVVAECPAVENTPEPAVIPFSTRKQQPRFLRFTRQRAALAAACLFLAVGIPAFGLYAFNPAVRGPHAVAVVPEPMFLKVNPSKGTEAPPHGVVPRVRRGR